MSGQIAFELEPGRPVLYHVGCSGGKDSSALVLWAIHESGIPRDQLRVTFCDTHNEDELTYKHIEFLRNEIVLPAGIPGGLGVLEPERGFYDLVRKKKRFPSRRAQFCTHELKIKPTQKWLEARWDEGFDTVVMSGRRRKESEQRAAHLKDHSDEMQFSDFWGCQQWDPLLDWTFEDVLAIHEKYQVPMNPLYALGAKRVGCFPCINSGKRDIRMVARVRPEKILEIADWEQNMEAEFGRFSSFIHSKGVPERFKSKEFTYTPKGEDEPITINVCTILDVVDWSRTEHGGHQYSLMNDSGLTFEDGWNEDSKPSACWANYGACE